MTWTTQKTLGGLAMYRLVATFGSILFGSTVAVAQNAAPALQLGYAVVTPAFPVTGMIVFQSFTQAGNLGTIEAGRVVPSNLMVNALMPIDVSSRLLRNVGVAIANPNNALASVTLTLSNSNGTQF